MATERVLVAGSQGQVGQELVAALRVVYGTDNVIASDIRQPESSEGPFEQLDIMDGDALLAIIRKHNITQVYQLAALLSATAEQKPELAWQLNMKGLFNVLDMAKDGTLKKVYWPSSIAVFGPSTPRVDTPQNTVMDPNTVYGISKLAGERWCEYYHQKFGVDVRSLRYPGLIGYQTMPGGGTTDYAVDIYHEALKSGAFECFLEADTALPMMYMPDAIRATIEVMEADSDRIRIRSSYNLSAMSFSPEDIARAIRSFIPEFTIGYAPDYRQAIAASWPASINDQPARDDWGWQEQYDLTRMSEDMLQNLRQWYTSPVH